MKGIIKYLLNENAIEWNTENQGKFPENIVYLEIKSSSSPIDLTKNKDLLTLILYNNNLSSIDQA